jgi:RNA polymerase sigma-70 factor (ECF subfamily)
MDTDEDLLAALARGEEEAVGPLYARYAPIVLGMASQALDRATAEDIVQDVFVNVWKYAASFDPARGPVRPWLLQIAHYRIANELRSRSRRPRIEADPDGERVAALPDPAPDQQAAAWTEYRRSALKRALERLPAPQRQALGLAFYEDLSHGEIARVLKLPLGTAKSRVRAGLLTLRVKLAPLVASLAVIALLAGAIYELAIRRRELRVERAIAMLTSSEAQALRLTPAPGASGVPATAHALYRYRPGTPIAVITYSYFAPAPEGRAYQAWALVNGRWISLGIARPDADGRARLIAEDPALPSVPEALEVTLEPEGGSSSPSGPAVVAWRR